MANRIGFIIADGGSIPVYDAPIYEITPEVYEELGSSYSYSLIEKESLSNYGLGYESSYLSINDESLVENLPSNLKLYNKNGSLDVFYIAIQGTSYMQGYGIKTSRGYERSATFIDSGVLEFKPYIYDGGTYYKIGTIVTYNGNLQSWGFTLPGSIATLDDLKNNYEFSDSPFKLALYMEWASPEGQITVNRGDIIENIFRLYRYPIDSEPIYPFTDVTIGFTSITDPDDTPQESLGPLFLDIQGTNVTIGERMYLNTFKLVAIANGYVYGQTDNPIHPEGDPVKLTKIVTVTDPWDRTYGDGGESSGGGGNGSHSGPGGTISGGGVPSYSTRGDLPTGSAEADSSNTGLFTRYALGSAGLRGIAAALYADTILQNIGKEVMSFLWNSPSDGLISLVSYPFSVTSLPNVNSSSVSKMKFGSLELPISSTRLGSTFSQIEWGTITLDEYWGNFLDYAPHTKIDLYLPWCTGSVSLDPHECLPGSIEVVTNVELAKGTCCHSIFGNKGALIGTYYGTCGSVLPLTAIDTSGKALALVTAAAGVMSAVGNAGAATTAGIAAANSPETSARAYGLELSRGLDPMSARFLAQREAIQAAEAPYRAAQNRGIKVAAPSAIAAFRTPANVVRNGSFVANGPGMAMQFPFIILSRPEQNIPTNYAGHYGYPSNVLASLGSVSGYTEVAAIHLDGISGATMNEIEEIDALLKGGVIL